MEFRSKILVDAKVAKHINECLGMDAEELYQKFGVKRYEELYSATAKFENGYQMDVNVVSCPEDPPYIDVALFDENGAELHCVVDEDDTIEGSKGICFDDDEYWADIAVA